MATKVRSYLAEKINWSQGSDPSFPYKANLNGDKLVIRINDFPDENLYTLIVNGEELTDFDDWPRQWVR